MFRFHNWNLNELWVAVIKINPLFILIDYFVLYKPFITFYLVYPIALLKLILLSWLFKNELTCQEMEPCVIATSSLTFCTSKELLLQWWTLSDNAEADNNNYSLSITLQACCIILIKCSLSKTELRIHVFIRNNARIYRKNWTLHTCYFSEIPLTVVQYIIFLYEYVTAYIILFDNITVYYLVLYM